MDEKEEKAYEDGRRSAYRSLMSECARELEGDERRLAALVAERADAVRVLRDLCAEHGSNDWPDNLHLSDVIERHLGRYLPEPKRER